MLPQSFPFLSSLCPSLNKKNASLFFHSLHRAACTTALRMQRLMALRTRSSSCQLRRRGTVSITSSCLSELITDPEKSSTPLSCCWITREFFTHNSITLFLSFLRTPFSFVSRWETLWALKSSRQQALRTRLWRWDSIVNPDVRLPLVLTFTGCFSVKIYIYFFF